MKKIIGIVDYEMGNLFSIIQACKTVGLEVEVINRAEQIRKCDGIILPGVGSFKKAMENIHKLGLYKDIIKHSRNKPLMGICLGFQLLFDSSEEFGKTKGLGIISGKILKFNNSKIHRVPHMGWNVLSYIKPGENPLINVKSKEIYFVHSYYAVCNKEEAILSKTEYYDFEFISSINQKHVFGTQFHPEKSGETGLKIYKNWAEINKLI